MHELNYVTRGEEEEEKLGTYTYVCVCVCVCRMVYSKAKSDE
jgi:hypothetical protein